MVDPSRFFHVYNRGVKKTPLFLRDEDYQRFLSRIDDYCLKYKLCLIAFCVMPNHYHLEVGAYNTRVSAEVLLGKMIHSLATSYGMYFNKAYKGSGHVFQGKYKRKQVYSWDYMRYLSRYIHQNPVEHVGTRKWHKSINYMRSYKWSSYRQYLGNPAMKSLNTRILRGLIGGGYKGFCKYTEKKMMKWELNELKREPSRTNGTGG